MLDAAPLAAASTIVFTSILARYAPALGLLDIPDERKRHEGNVPIVGGLAIGFAYLLASMLLLPDSLSRPVVDAGIVLLLCVGAIDDRVALKPRWRLLGQCAVALALVAFGGLQLTSFGDLFGFGEVSLSPVASVLLTIFFVVSLINGFNMLDGLDGLAGGVGAIMLIALCLAAVSVGATASLVHTLIFLAGLLGFLVFHNIRSPLRRRLIFMGEAGSTVLGFVLAWSAIDFVENPQGSIYPISIVWVFGIVVLDTSATVIRRVLQRRRPLSPARDHLHHLMLEFGMSPQKVVCLIYGAAIAMSVVGLAGFKLGIQESWLTISFVAISAVYYAGVTAAWRRVAARKNVAHIDRGTLAPPRELLQPNTSWFSQTLAAVWRVRCSDMVTSLASQDRPLNAASARPESPGSSRYCSNGNDLHL
jgi:UDP-GlcNAc:undecaprenyl-phosphate/decaprenyl-phosphate GlcNAc-1-phosphate transferase